MNDSIWKKFPDPALIDFGVDGSGTGYRLEKMGGCRSNSATALDNGESTPARTLGEGPRRL
jgi:hypothetical protein